LCSGRAPGRSSWCVNGVARRNVLPERDSTRPLEPAPSSRPRPTKRGTDLSRQTRSPKHHMLRDGRRDQGRLRSAAWRTSRSNR
jgi:hypothetical protein